METLILVLGVLSAELSAADPPGGLYIAEGVSYVGCFEHGRAQDEEVLSSQTNPDCTFNSPGSCLTPPTCIESCQNTSTSFIYVGLKWPGLCYCDSVLRGVNQTDSVDGIHCDARCSGDSQLACGNAYQMLVYRLSSLPPSTTSPAMIRYTTPVPGYTTRPETVAITTNKGDIENQSQVNTGLIAGVTVGATALLVVILSAVYIYMRRKRTTGDKSTSTGTERAHYVNGQFMDDEQRARTNQDVPDRNRPIPTPPCDSSDVYLEPGVPIDDHEYTYVDNRHNALSNDDSNYVNQPPNHRYVNASEIGAGLDPVVYEVVPRQNRVERGGQYMNVGYSHNQDRTYVNM